MKYLTQHVGSLLLGVENISQNKGGKNKSTKPLVIVDRRVRIICTTSSLKLR